MTITIKDFGQFILDFVNANFIPLLQAGIVQHQKCLQQWREVSDLIRDIQKQKMWTFQSYLKGKPSQSVKEQSKEPVQLKKAESTRPSVTNFNSFENFLEKKDPLRNTYAYEDQLKINNNSKNSSKEQSDSRNKSFKYSVSNDDFESKLSFQPKAQRQKSELPEDNDGFDRLIQSFKKLCQNFENNHKKLLKQDKNLKENLKIELTHH